MVKECSNCFFYKDYGCHKNPPVRLPRIFDQSATAGNRIRNEAIIWGWPYVIPKDWCGKWKKVKRWC